MKIRLLSGIIILIILSLSINFNGRGQKIDGFEIKPENPSNTDEVTIIVSTTFPFLDCRLDSLHTFYACGAFAFDGFYNTGFETGNCASTDTISLGILPNGPYMISFRMYYLGWAQVDQVDTFISVGTTGLSHLLIQADQGLSIRPNPARGPVSLVIESERIDRVQICNLAGKLIRDYFTGPTTSMRILDVSLPPGLYLCTAYQGHFPLERRKFIILR